MPTTATTEGRMLRLAAKNPVFTLLFVAAVLLISLSTGYVGDYTEAYLNNAIGEWSYYAEEHETGGWSAAVAPTTGFANIDGTNDDITVGGGGGRGGDADLRDFGRIWIDVVSYAEGIAGWSVSLRELLALARTVNGTLVEPCMTNGRLGSCFDHGVPVGEIFDLSDFVRSATAGDGDDVGFRPPAMVSYDDYQRYRRAVNRGPRSALDYAICMSTLSTMRCTQGITDPMKINKKKFRQHVADKKLPIVVRLEDFWKDNSVKKIATLFGVKVRAPSFKDLLPFHPRHVRKIEEVLWESDVVGDDFSVIHWRAEKKGMNFAECAEAVLDAKRAMTVNDIAGGGEDRSAGHNQHRFVLMTSLNRDPEMMWQGSKVIAGSKANNTAQQALDRLLRDGEFIKFDDLRKKRGSAATGMTDEDPGMLAVYDLILASKSRRFATCARDGGLGCDDDTARKLCEKCNHVGKFGKLALSLRRDGQSDGSSWACWPRTTVGQDGARRDFVSSKRKYRECRRKAHGSTAHASSSDECFEEARKFVETSLLWALLGAKKSVLDLDKQSKILAQAEECVSSQQVVDGHYDDEDYPFRVLVGDLYLNMGFVKKKQNATSQAAAFFKKALEINPENEDVQTFLSQFPSSQPSEERGGEPGG